MNDGQQEETRAPRRHPVPSRHAKIMRGIVTPIFGLLAVTCIVFGVLNQTIWKPSREITAVAHVGDTQYVIVDPGVLDLVDTLVDMRAEAASVTPAANGASTVDDTATDDANVEDAAKEPQTCIAITSPKDASGWLAGEPYTRVTGLDTWSTLSTVKEKAQGTASASTQQVAFADSDMWVDTSCGDGSASLRLSDAKATQVAIIDFGGDASDATISMHWTRQNVPDFAMPWYFGGGLCAILAVLSASVFAMDPESRRNRFAKFVKPREKKEREEETTTITAAVAGTFASLKPRKRPKSADGKPRGRHGRHAGAAVPESEDGPQIVDPMSRNLVAEQARHADNGPAHTSSSDASSDEATSVITPEELQAYFARLVEETGPIPVVGTDTDETPDTGDNGGTSDDDGAAEDADTVGGTAGNTVEEVVENTDGAEDTDTSEDTAADADTDVAQATVTVDTADDATTKENE